MLPSGGQGQLRPAKSGCFYAADGQQDGREGHQGGDNEGVPSNISNTNIK